MARTYSAQEIAAEAGVPEERITWLVSLGLLNPDGDGALRLVKLLGDGALLWFPDPNLGVEAALDLVRTMSDEGAIAAHAGIHAGPVIERDLDVFGRTVNLASRIADVAQPGEVLATRAVVEGAVDGPYRFEPFEDVDLKGIPEPVPLFRVIRGES